MNLAYSVEAVADLRRLREFIALHDPMAAARVAAKLLEQIGRLGEFPHLGRVVENPAAHESLRDLVVGKYIVRYAVHGNTLVELRVWHHYEDRAGGV
ncbi:MAG: type II toxin-antitoxin system RelE/ParE family toxin [Proteobacteria bacterium]|nr:type II toxin-antitoxin system RelE/ParE family toxin [Pseudomonadota bacterium]